MIVWIPNPVTASVADSAFVVQIEASSNTWRARTKSKSTKKNAFYRYVWGA